VTPTSEHDRRATRRTLGRLALLATVSLAGAGCMRAVPYVSSVFSRPPQPDSATVALWAMDEPSGDRVGDSGPYGLSGTAGLDARADFGRFHGARSFASSIESFIFVPYAPVLETGPELSIEAWVFVNDFNLHELGPIAGRWSEKANEQSWIMGIIGKQPRALTPTGVSPGLLRHLVVNGETGHVLFAFQPTAASAALSFYSSEPLELERWTHIAVTVDDEVVRFYLNGRIDSQFATQNSIRPSLAPLLIGNYFDTAALTRFGGRLRLDPGFDTTPYYAFTGWIDELRLSNRARTEFGSTPSEDD